MIYVLDFKKFNQSIYDNVIGNSILRPVDRIGSFNDIRYLNGDTYNKIN